MRENLARLIVVITGVMVIALSMLFSRMQNPHKPSIMEINQAVKGEFVFQEQGCVRCHSFKGAGNPGFPLDGVAEKYSDKELLAWITGAQSLEGVMSPGVMKIKSKYQTLSETDLDALMQYLGMQ